MKKIAILGDSYSTYEGYIPADYLFWYGRGGNALENDVGSVEDTWWMILSKDLDLDLVANCSYSGSTVCYTGYPGYDGVKTSFVHRMQREFQNLLDNHVCPDVIFLFGGTNDFWNQSPVGEIRYRTQTQEDLAAFAPAFCNVVEYLKDAFPDSCLVTVVNDDITSVIRDIEAEVSHHYGAELVELREINKQNGHPSKIGMRQIAEQISQALSKRDIK